MPLNPIKFPNAEDNGCQKLSDATPKYNCIAFANGDTENWWEPHADGKWPDDIPYEWTLISLTLLFQRDGYVVCQDSELEPELEKVAIYALNGIPTHAALQLFNGKWASKLGKDKDIVHDALDALNGPYYGEAVLFMRRPRE